MKTSYAKHILSLLLFGTNGIVAANIFLSSYNIVLLRTFIGSIVLLLLCLLLQKDSRLSLRENLREVGFIALSGIAMGTSWMFLYEAYAQLGVGISTVLYNCGPVIVMVLSPVIFKEKLTFPKILGFLAVLVGVFLINDNASGSLNVWGVTCGLLSALTYSVMVMANKKSTNIKGIHNTLIQLIFGFLTVAVFIFFKGGFNISVPISQWIWILILGIINTGIGCYLYFSSINSLPAQSVATLGYIESLSAVIFSFLLLGEIMTPLQYVGAFCIIGGAFLGECVKQKRRM